MNTATETKIDDKATSTTAPDTDNYIPDDSEVQTPINRRPTYRFSRGKICTGREEDGTLVELPKIVGRIRRIGVHSGLTKETQIPYQQVEADIETSRGNVRIKASLSDKTGKFQPSTSALSFSEGLLELAKDELCVITAQASTKKNAYGTYSTYANAWHYDGKTSPRPTRRRPIDKSKTMDEQWHLLEAELRSHPAFAERPASEKDEEAGPTHFSEFCRECTEKSWTTPEQNPQGWLVYLAKVAKEPAPRASLASYTQDDWGTLRQALASRTEIPKSLADALAANDPFASGSSDYD